MGVEKLTRNCCTTWAEWAGDAISNCLTLYTRLFIFVHRHVNGEEHQCSTSLLWLFVHLEYAHDGQCLGSRIFRFISSLRLVDGRSSLSTVVLLFFNRLKPLKKKKKTRARNAVSSL